MNGVDVALLRNLLAAATPGDWVLAVDGENTAVEAGELHTNPDGWQWRPHTVCDDVNYYPQAVSVADMRLIVAMQNAMGALLDAYAAVTGAPEADVLSAHIDHVRIDPVGGIDLAMIGRRVRLVVADDPRYTITPLGAAMLERSK